jgi:hypothetical protein
MRQSPPAWRALSAAANCGRSPRSDRQLLASAGAAGGQHSASSGGLHPGAEAVFLGAMPLLRLKGLLHRLVCFSPFGLGVRIPRKARERAWRPEALWRVCRRIICTRGLGCQTSGGFGRPPPRRRGRSWPILPGSIRLRTLPNLAGARKPVLFFGGPRRQTLRSRGPEDRDEPSEPLGGEAETGPMSRLWRRILDDRVRQAKRPNHQVCFRTSPARWTLSRSGARHLESCRYRSLQPISKHGFGTRASSTSTTIASRSPSRTALPRIGSRPATGP